MIGLSEGYQKVVRGSSCDNFCSTMTALPNDNLSCHQAIQRCYGVVTGCHYGCHKGSHEIVSETKVSLGQLYSNKRIITLAPLLTTLCFQCKVLPYCW